jgi:hypothetical protein
LSTDGPEGLDIAGACPPAQALGVVTQAVDEPSLRSAAIGCVHARGAKPAGAVGRIKQDLYAPALALLEQAAAA